MGCSILLPVEQKIPQHGIMSNGIYVSKLVSESSEQYVLLIHCYALKSRFSKRTLFKKIDLNISVPILEVFLRQ